MTALQGYLAASDYPGGPCTEIINPCRTLGYIKRKDPTPYKPTIAWHSEFWPGSPDMLALGYADGALVPTLLNETGETDATSTAGATWVATDPNLGGVPSVQTDRATNDMATAAFAVAPSYAAGVSIVVIAYNGDDSGVIQSSHLVDGIIGTNRNMMRKSSVDYASIYAGTSSIQTVSPVNPVGAHGYVGFFDGSTGADTLRLDGTQVVSADAGSHTLTGLSIGSAQGSTTVGWDGSIAFMAIYEGDITADPEWPAFVRWARMSSGVELDPSVLSLTPTYPDPHWEPGGARAGQCIECCSACFESECTCAWPGDPEDPAPWYDASLTASAEFFGFLIDTFTITKGYNSGRRQASRHRRRLRRNKREGKITGHLVSSTCAGTTFGLEWLTQRLAFEQDCGADCGGMDLQVHKQDCQCDGIGARENGWRWFRGAGGFEIDVMPEDLDGYCVPCCEGAYVEITFEIDNSQAWFPPMEIDTILTTETVGECQCNLDQYFGDCCELTEFKTVTKSRRTRPVRVMADRTLCPVGWEPSNYDPATDQFVIGGFEELDAIASTTGVILSLQEDVTTGVVTAVDAVTGLVFSPSVECGTDISVVEICYRNETYDPTCLDCPQAQQICADNAGLVVAADGFINLPAGPGGGIAVPSTITVLDGNAPPANLQALLDYWECIDLQGGAPNITTQPVYDWQAILDEAKSTTSSYDRMCFKFSENTITLTSSNSASCQGAVDTDVVLSTFPGFGSSPIGDDDSCGREDHAPDHCLEQICEVPDFGKPLSTSVTIDANGIVTFDTDTLPANFASGGSNLFSPYVGTYLVENPNCEECEDFGELLIRPSDDGDSTFSWSEVDWSLIARAQFPPSGATLVLTDQPTTYETLEEVCLDPNCPDGDCGAMTVPDLDFTLNLNSECEECEPIALFQHWVLIPPDSLALASTPIISIRSTDPNEELPWVKVIAIEDRPALTGAGMGPDTNWLDGWDQFDQTLLAVTEPDLIDISIDASRGETVGVCRTDSRPKHLRHDGCHPIVRRVGLWIGVFTDCEFAGEFEVVVQRASYEAH